MYGPDDAIVQRATGPTHRLPSPEYVSPILSWFSLVTETGAPLGGYTLGLTRLDLTGKPLPYTDASGNTAIEWRSPPVKAAAPK
jgi:hypothetical protein